TPGEWVYFPKNTSIEYDVGSDESQGSILYVDSGDFTQAQTDRNGEFIALANPANILALVEALEKAQAQSSKWLEAYHKAVSIGARYEERIAELESRTITVKQYDEFQICHYGATEDYAKGYIDCQKNFSKWLTASGIKVEAE
ncbi:ead/Ea22-like family protein, partial [Klebsiella pneumoniae]|nr:ead/Ea22-like family protein [Klebsiella pneumoniae]